MSAKCDVPKVRLLLKKTKCTPSGRLSNPATIADYLRSEYGNAGQEWFIAIALSADMRALAVIEVSAGGLDQAAVDPKTLFAGVLLAGAVGFVVAHNHPSGNASPSDADMRLTRQLVDGAKLLALRVMDHLILTTDRVYSMMAEGVLPR